MLVDYVLKVVSNDGKKVRRKHPFTEKDKEELHVRNGCFLYYQDMSTFINLSSSLELNVYLMWSTFLVFQSRIVVAENLPEDHSHQNLERIFSVVGRLDLLTCIYFFLVMNILRKIHISYHVNACYQTV